MGRSHGKTLAWIAVTMAVALAAAAAPASATPYGVTTTADTVNDANCQPSSCTLRQAVNAASANPGLDSISLPVGNFHIELEFGQLVVKTTAVDISGAGMGSTTLISSRHSRVLQIQGDSTVTVANLKITQGKSPAGTNGGGINVAAGANTLTLDHVIVADNDAQASGATSAEGGGIATASSDQLSVMDSQITNNRAAGGTGTTSGTGGGIASTQDGPVSIVDSTIAGNTATGGASGTSGGFGGGVSFTQGGLTITNSTLANNTAAGGSGGGRGGAVASGSVTVDSSTFSGNTAKAGSAAANSGGEGGAIQTNGGTITLTNSTGSDNTAEGSSSGGIGGFIESNGGKLTFANSTLDENTASGNGGRGGNIAPFAGSVKFVSAIVAGGVAQNGSNCASFSNIFTSIGRNLESADTCFLGPGDLKNTDPLLGPLAANGGPTQTRALLPGSPAIDQAVGCPPPATDQRGVARPLGAACDLGAFEFEPPPPAPPPPVTPPVVASVPPKDTVPAKLSALRFSPTAFRALGAGGSIVSRAPLGARVSYSLSERATTTFTIERRVTGRRSGRRCSTTRRRGRRCSTFKKVSGSFRHSGKQGANSFRFSGRLRGRKLPPGSYRLTGLPVDTAGNRGKPVRATFRIVR